MHNDMLRRCYLCMVLLAVGCLLTLLLTTRIANIATLNNLSSICTSKLKIKTLLEEISNKQDITNMKLFEAENGEKPAEIIKQIKLWNDKRNDYDQHNKENPVEFSAVGAKNWDSLITQKYDDRLQANVDAVDQADENYDDKVNSFSTQIESDKQTVDNISKAQMSNMNSIIGEHKIETSESKRSSVIEEHNANEVRFGNLNSENRNRIDIGITNNLQSSPLRYRKYGEDWLMTKDELNLLRHWCIERDYRINWNRILEPCRGSTVWSPYKPYWTTNNITTAANSYIFDPDIRPAGQYSRFYIQSVAQDGTKRNVGGDSWRVHIKGASNVPVTVMDHKNGVYEVFFLITQDGKYEAEIVLDYTLCDGMKDPPIDWFIKGNVQGKYQHPDALPGNEHPYLLESLPHGFNFTIKVADVSVFEEMKENGLLEKYCPNPSCMIWDGYGAWIDNTWQEYLSAKKERDAVDRRDGTLWIYGDSVGDLFYKSISKRALCHEIFENCNHTYNWVYALKNMNITEAKVEWDNKDFSIDRIISELDDVISNPAMNDRSVIIINMGLHLVQGVNFTSYKKLIGRVIDLLLTHKEMPHGFHGKAIWKTTTALFKERYGDPKSGARHAKGLRFLTVPRLQLFNAFATTAMCNSGIDVLDVYPMSDSYPEGTGGVKKPWDAVHFHAKAFMPVEDLLEEYLG